MRTFTKNGLCIILSFCIFILWNEKKKQYTNNASLFFCLGNSLLNFTVGEWYETRLNVRSHKSLSCRFCVYCNLPYFWNTLYDGYLKDKITLPQLQWFICHNLWEIHFTNPCATYTWWPWVSDSREHKSKTRIFSEHGICCWTDYWQYRESIGT
jgi:hypothetical protein